MLDAHPAHGAIVIVPFTVGGGIRQLDDAAAVFDAGADKIAINSAAVREPKLIGEIAGDSVRRRWWWQSMQERSMKDFEVYVAGGRVPRAGMRLNGHARPPLPAQGKFCSLPWTAMEPQSGF